MLPSSSIWRQIGCNFFNATIQTPRILHRPSRWEAVKRYASSASSTRWKTRQSKDHYAREARVKGLKSRAAFKLLEVNQKHRIFKEGYTVVDLGYAPGSWSQVAVSRTQPNGRVIGVDVIPAQPPRGVSTIQGNFLDRGVQAHLREYVLDPNRGRPRRPQFLDVNEENEDAQGELHATVVIDEDSERSYIDMERRATVDEVDRMATISEGCSEGSRKKASVKEKDHLAGRVVDVVLSDMSEPWPQTTGSWVKSVSDPYRRMMNTSGVAFRDHAGSMDLCLAALSFCFDTLRTGGHFICKYYQGAEDKSFEKKLKRLFEKVHREKPEASRDVSTRISVKASLKLTERFEASKEAYFVALRRKTDPTAEQVFDDD